jgi:hypothetical protein
VPFALVGVLKTRLVLVPFGVQAHVFC